MEKRAKGTRNKLGDLARAYGSFAEMGRSMEKVTGIPASKLSRQLSRIVREGGDVPDNIKKAANRRHRYFFSEKPRAAIKRAEGIDEKISVAKELRQELGVDKIDVRELLPEGYTFYAFDFAFVAENDPEMQGVVKALEEGLSIKVTVASTDPDGNVSHSVGTISGDLFDAERQLMHIARRAYGKSGKGSSIRAEIGGIDDIMMLGEG